ncbi:MAG: GNAT family N-acetyltransferase [Nocardioides sp.]
MPHRETRLLTYADLEASVRLGTEAFGDPPTPFQMPDPANYPFPGRHSWGTFEDGRLVARTVLRDYESWFRGARVPTAGIAGVTVAAESRGAGLLPGLLAATLAEGAARGQVLSTLYPTAPGIYRRLGYELVGSFDTVEVPTAALAAVPAPDGITLRRASVADVPRVREVYAAWAAQQNGPLTRDGASFPASDEELLADVTGTTLAVDGAGRVLGYASWRRGTGYDHAAVIDVPDLVCLDPAAARALWRLLGSFASVTGRVRLHTSGDDLARLVLPFLDWEVVHRHPYMLRVHDVAGALEALPLAGTASTAFRVVGDPLGTMDGGYRLVVAEGQVACTRDDVAASAPTFTPQGLALAYAGAQSAGNLRLAGHLVGGDDAFDATLDALLGGRQVHVRDYF